MKQVDMEMDQKNQPSMVSDNCEYPYGLRIYLDEEQLAKLGIKKLPDIDSEMQIEATVEVCSTSLNESSEGGVNRSMYLQITSLALGSPKAESSADEKLYGSSDV